jgi:putative NADH-flavin reductase
MLVSLTRSVLDAAARSSLRVLVIGGAASLKMPDQSGDTVLTAPGFLPDAAVPIAKACQAQYELCAVERRVDWSYLCPPAMLTPGVRTGRYRLGSDTLLVDADEKSAISMEDFAVALIDEAEAPRHKKARFTVAREIRFACHREPR